MSQVLIRRLRSLAALDKAAVDAIADALDRTYKVGSDTDIVVRGTRQSECHVLLGGMAALYKSLSDGRRQVVNFALAGEFMDLDSYVVGALDHNVVALGPCSVGVISHAAIRELTQRHPDIALALWRHTAADAAVFREWVVNVGQRTGPQRLAHIVCELFSRLSEVGLATEISGRKTFSWHVPQTVLADAAGLSIVHVNRSLQDLGRRGILEINEQKVTVFDWPGLQAVAGFEPDYLSAGWQTRPRRLADPTQAEAGRP